MLGKEQRKNVLLNKTLSGIAIGSMLVGGVVPIGQVMWEGGLMTVEAASDIPPRALEPGDRVAQSSYGLKFKNGTINRVTAPPKATANIVLEFEIVDGVRNNSAIPMGLRLQATNPTDPDFQTFKYRTVHLMESGTDLKTTNGQSVGQFARGIFYFNDRVEDYVGSTIQIRMENVHMLQFVTPNENADSIRDNFYWDVVVGLDILKSRDVLGVIKEEGNLWYRMNPQNVYTQTTNYLSVRDNVPYLDLMVIPGNNEPIQELIGRSNAPITFRVEYDTNYFGPIPEGQKAILNTYDSSHKPVHARHTQGYVNWIREVPGYANLPGANIKKLRDGVYEFTIDNPRQAGLGVSSAGMTEIELPILNMGAVDKNNLRFNRKPKITMYQNGRVVGGTEFNSSIQNYIHIETHDQIARGDASVSANTSYRDDREVEVIPYETIRRENPDLPVGQERVIQHGREGERTRTYTVLYINGRPTSSKTLKSEQVTRQAVDHIIEVGTGVVSDSVQVKVEEIPYETERIENPDLPAGEERVVQRGEKGSKKITITTPMINGKPMDSDSHQVEITKHPVKEIIEVGVGVVDQRVDVNKEPIPYETETIYDENLPEGERVVDQEGVVGEKTITTTTPTLNGQPNGPAKTTEEVTKEPVKEIIRVGSGVVSEDVKVDVKELPFDTETRENPDLPKGEERVIQEGETGSLTITTTTPTLNGQPNGEPTVDERITKEPVNKIIEVGVGTLGEKVDVETVELPYETERVSNPDLPKGEERVIQEGEVGTLTITTTTPTLNDQPHGESVVKEEVTKDPVNKIIEVGTGIIAENVQEEKVELPYHTETIYDENLPEGKEEVIQVGEKGEKVIVTTTPTLNGEPNGDPVVKETVTKEPINQIIRIGTGKVAEDVQEEKVEIPFETEYRENPDLPKGEEKVAQEGVVGEKVVVTKTPTLNGEPQGDPVVEEKVTKEPVNKIIEVGVGTLGEDVKEEKVKLPFETEYRENPDLPEGEEKVVQKGVVGEKVVTTKTPTLNGKPAGEGVVSEKVTKEPVNQIIEVGKGNLSEDVKEEKVEIPFETEYRENPDLPEGEEKVVQVGEVGEKVVTTKTPTLNGKPIGESTTSEKVTKEPVNQIIEVGKGNLSEDVKEEKVEISFETEYRENPDLPEGEEKVVQEGVVGEKVVTTKTPTLNGEPVGESITTEKVTKEPIKEIIEVGKGSLSEEVIEEEVEIPFETQYRENPDLPEGEQSIIQQGVPGEKVVITTTPTLNGEPIGESSTAERVVKEPVTQIIEVGIGSLSEDITEEEVEIPFETQYRENPDLPEGEQSIIQQGVPGEKVITTTTPTLNGEPIGESTTTEKVTKEPVVQIIEVGIGALSEESIDEVIEIPFETEIVYDETLPEGEEVIEQRGDVGERTITTTTQTLNGKPIGEPTTTEKVTKEPIKEIIRVGSGVPSEEVTIEQKEIPFETKEVEDPNLPQGERIIEQQGIIGVLTITTKTPTLNGQPSGQPTVEEVVTKEAQDQIIRVGVGQVDTPEPDEKPDEPKQNVKTGVESVATNPTLLTTLGTAISGLLGVFGFKARRRKKK